MPKTTTQEAQDILSAEKYLKKAFSGKKRKVVKCVLNSVSRLGNMQTNELPLRKDGGNCERLRNGYGIPCCQFAFNASLLPEKI